LLPSDDDAEVLGGTPGMAENFQRQGTAASIRHIRRSHQ
jgi:hypothetical protein